MEWKFNDSALDLGQTSQCCTICRAHKETETSLFQALSSHAVRIDDINHQRTY